MSDPYVHGPETIEVERGPRPVRGSKSSVIGLIGTAPTGAVNQPRQVWPQREAGDVLAVDPCALSSAQQQQAKKLLESGHNRKQLALLYGVSLASIYKYCPVNRNARTGQNGFDEK